MSDDRRDLTQDEHDLMIRALIDFREKIADIPDAMNDWQPIETAPRLENILIFMPGNSQPVMEAWWKMPYEGALMKQCAWQTMRGTCLSADVHRAPDGYPLGATHWRPLPEPPKGGLMP